MRFLNSFLYYFILFLYSILSFINKSSIDRTQPWCSISRIEMWLNGIIISRKETKKNNTKLQFSSTWIVSPRGCFRAPVSGTSTTWKKVNSFELKWEVQNDFCFSFFFLKVGSQPILKEKNTVNDNKTNTSQGPRRIQSIINELLSTSKNERYYCQIEYPQFLQAFSAVPAGPPRQIHLCQSLSSHSNKK